MSLPSSFRFGWNAMRKQNGCQNEHVLSKFTLFILKEEITLTLQESVSILYPLLPDGMVKMSLQLYRSKKADLQPRFCNLPKESPPKSADDLIRKAQRCALISHQSTAARIPSITLFCSHSNNTICCTLKIPMPRSSQSLLT